MPSISRSALVSHPAPDMYELVRDIESYPSFLPWCAAARVAEQSESHQLASISMDRRMKGLEFTTRNRLEPVSAIHMGLVDGPFRNLNGVWRFQAIDESSCKVQLAIDFEFRSRLLAALLSGAFTRICDSMVAAFVKRADQLALRFPNGSKTDHQ